MSFLVPPKRFSPQVRHDPLRQDRAAFSEYDSKRINQGVQPIAHFANRLHLIQLAMNIRSKNVTTEQEYIFETAIVRCSRALTQRKVSGKVCW